MRRNGMTLQILAVSSERPAHDKIKGRLATFIFVLSNKIRSFGFIVGIYLHLFIFLFRENTCAYLFR